MRARAAWYFWVIVLLGSAYGCGSQGTTANSDAAGDSDIGDGGAALVGRVMAPLPVSGARIRLFVVSSPTPTAWGTDQVIAEATSSDQGIFEMEVPDGVVTGSVLVVRLDCSKASMETGGGSTALGQGFPLEAIFLWEGGQTGTLVVDLWSTLAVALAEGEQRATLLDFSEVNEWRERVRQVNRRVGEHLLRPGGIDIPWVIPAEVGKGELSLSSPSTVLALGNLALWRVAGKEEASGTELGDFIKILQVDLSDGVFDGRGFLTADEEVAGKLEGLDSNTTRYALAEALHSFFNDPGMPVSEAPGVAVEELGIRKGLYWMWSMDDGPLYVASDEMRLFDPFLPKLWFSVAPDESQEICKGFTVEVQASDNASVAELSLESPLWAEAGFAPEYDQEEGTAKASVQLDPSDAGPGADAIALKFKVVDGTGNEATVERTLSIHVTPPEITHVSPDPAICLGVRPDTFKVLVSDPMGVAKVEVVEVGALHPCEESVDGLWECGLVNLSPLVRATDQCGAVSELRTDLCVDSEAPKIEWELPEPMCGPAHQWVMVTVTDNMGVAKVQVERGEEILEIDDFSGPFKADFDLLGPDPAVLVVRAWDIWNMEAHEAISCPLEVTPPVVTVPEGSLLMRPVGTQVEFEITVTDDQSSVTTVSVAGTMGSWEVVPDGDGYRAIGNVALPLTDGQAIEVSIVAADYYGNQSDPVVVTLLIDGANPIVKLVPSSVFDETDVTPEISDETMEVTYDLTGAPVVEFSQENCAISCPQFGKLASRLSEDGLWEPADQNIAVFRFTIDEPCPVLGGAASWTTVVATFYRDDILLKSELIEFSACGESQIEVPVSIERFADVGPGEFSFEESNIPNRLRIDAADVVGNQGSKEVYFTMNVISVAPHMKRWVPETPGEEWVPGIIDSADPKLNLLSDSPRTLTAYKYYNPFNVPLLISSPGAPIERMAIQSVNIYTNPKMTAAFQCILESQCKYWITDDQIGDCKTAITWELEDYYRNMAMPTIAYWEDGESSVEMGHGVMVLEPGEEALVSYRTSYSTNGLEVAVATPLAIDIGDVHKAHVVGGLGWTAECKRQEGGGSVLYDLPSIIAMYTSAPATNTKAQWQSGLKGGEIWVSGQHGVTWNHLYLPDFSMHQSPYK